MKPLSPQERRRIIEAHPNAAPGEIEADLEEYERLVARMFQSEPDAAAHAGAEVADAGEFVRLAELHGKLFKQ